MPQLHEAKFKHAIYVVWLLIKEEIKNVGLKTG
jgi:hypothetical protein